MEEKDLHLTDHLEELRKRLIITALAFITFFIIGFIYVEDIYHWFVKDLDVKLIALGPSDIIWVYFMLSSVFAIAITIPIIALQLWLFVRPALLPSERKITLTYIPALFFLFVLGLCFGYFVIFPTVLKFIIELSGEMMVANFTAEKYFRFILNMTLPFAILFELPVVVMFLTSIGIINPYFLQQIRKYAYFLLVVISVTITPPDLVSDFLVTVPLLLLYEISITLSKIVYRRRLRKLAENPEENELEEYQ